ncbi:D-alanyl-lipoteichoic acid acyltransferase DltB (MBOAT superfamily) [Flavobacterium sp. 102]|nr:D-alanyl-lipoteichoic acid acyltransferase DltB (MBOAT superfamily) [Flavobacterium sp. 102]
MLFNSLDFLLFFPLVCILFFGFPTKYRWLLLLVASCYFYMYFIPIYILILAGTIVIDYFAGILIENNQGTKRRFYLIMSLFANILVLAVFKYYNFFIENIEVLLAALGSKSNLPYLSILLPVGLSFHTFQAMSYTIEVYRGNQKAEKHFGIYALYVMFFPQLVAGPIERPQNVLHQFHEKKYFLYENFAKGFKLIIWGFFMKVVVADRLALYVNAAYNNVDNHNGSTLLLATVFFSFQIYCDFAGYSSIAIGTAKIMGFDLMTNFNRPYFAKTISEFWKRWHISLSTWFRDYLYLPLGGNKVSRNRWYFNLFFVFLVSGIWHGANWTFFIWGALNGAYLVIAIVTQRYRNKFNDATGLSRNRTFFTAIQIITTFILSSFAWIFFRANNVQEAFTIVEKIGTDLSTDLFVKWDVFFGVFIGLSVLILKEFRDEFLLNKLSFLKKPNVSILFYAFIVALILLMGVFDEGQFIYFQF